MSYLVLARKYRPQELSSIKGQEHITKALTNAIVRGRIPHALLFSGPRGVGKTTSARVLAKALNCTGRLIPTAEAVRNQPELISGVEPCGECSNCKDITRGSSLAVLEIDGASHTSVDNVRDLIDTLHTAPPPGLAYKIYIIDEVHMLSNAAFNALLKSLEEPPTGTIFIFATTEPHKIPETVISRCQQHDFRRIPLKIIADQLSEITTEEGFEVDNEVLHVISRRCQGGMRDATTLLDRVCASCDGKVTVKDIGKILGIFDISHFREIAEHILGNNPGSAIEVVGSAFGSSIDVRSYLGDFLELFRLLALYSLSLGRGEKARERFIQLEELSDVQCGHLSELATKTGIELSNLLFSQTREIVDQAIRSEYPRYVLEAGIMNLCRLNKIIPLGEVIDQLGALRNQLAGVDEGVKKKTGSLNGSLPDNELNNKNGSLSLNPPAIHVSAIKNEGSDSDFLSPEISSVSEFIWKDFISFLRSGNDLRLDAYLRRAAPVVFSMEPGGSGTLELVAPAFVIDALTDPDTNSLLKERLASFASGSRRNNDEVGRARWNVRFRLPDELNASVTDKGFNQREDTNEITVKHLAVQRKISTVSKKHRSYVPGSLAADSEKKIIKKLEGVEKEAREDVLVKVALDVFEGSAIERIVPITRE
ncbi:MAG TPA: DNA polymerase III subunit gamma/tau [Oligoflexia bacterium]|nr:DNA polymerase III subunit gamma/tau [Oligoflexia bacterium]HMP49280.1 DNA polymerase III subunit gamma/tau [Oligoflexia bacterium]